MQGKSSSLPIRLQLLANPPDRCGSRAGLAEQERRACWGLLSARLKLRDPWKFGCRKAMLKGQVRGIGDYKGTPSTPLGTEAPESILTQSLLVLLGTLWDPELAAYKWVRAEA